MPKLALLNQAGENVGEITLLDSVFGIEPNQQALFDVVKSQRAAMRQGTHDSKTRSEVRGGGRKPWRQKGTGRARQGSIRSPQWVGGGVVFGPTPRSYILKVNRKVRRLALKSVLSSKVNDKQIFVLDALALETPKTKDMIQVLNNLSLSGKVMIVLDQMNETVALAARNIPGVFVTTVEQASVYELLNYPVMVTTQDAVKKYEEVLG
ncbi:MAG: 50S ribosomal protein L4 [Candidatus Izemoplasmataceae bacterium]|uniref:50S ribosomal protein L4 n=1 Tax=Liberiplasma polymorphum TaxID=3374570 RepID=UPI0037717102